MEITTEPSVTGLSGANTAARVFFSDAPQSSASGLSGAGFSASAGPAQPLETSTDKCSPPQPILGPKVSERLAVNRLRFDFLRRESSVSRQRGCMKIAVNGTALVLDGGGVWRCSGLMRCSRVDCPSCGVVILGERQDDIERAADRWVRYHGGTLAFVTLTFSHKKIETYADVTQVRAAAWRSIGRGQRWANDRAKYGVVGFIRVNEDTWGDKYGWHCHIHVLVFLAHAPGSKQATWAVTGLAGSMFRRWSYSLVKTGRRVSKKAQKAQEVTGAEAAKAMGDYLTKQLDVPKRELGKAMAAELMGAAHKRAGRKVEGVHLSVTDLLDLAMAGDEAARELYNLREIANVGKRSISWSNGLRQLLGFAEDEISDADVAAADDADKRAARVVFSIRQKSWSKLSRLRFGMGRLLEIGEARGEDAAADYLRMHGIDFELGDPQADVQLAAFDQNELWPIAAQQGETLEQRFDRIVAPAAVSDRT